MKNLDDLRIYLKKWWKAISALTVIAIFGFILRICNLTYLPVFADEAIYIRWSQIMNSEPTLRFLPLSDGKQPLFMWILMFLVRQFENPLFIGRLISVVSGTGAIFGIFILSFIFFQKKQIALLAALIYTVSPFVFFFDRMALVDSLLSTLTIWTFIFAILTSKKLRLDTALLTGFFLGFAALTKSPALFVAMLLPTTFIFAPWTKNRKNWLFIFINLCLLLGVTYLIALGFYNIQRLGPNFHLLTSRTKDYVFPISHILESPFDPFKAYFHRALQWIWIMGPSVLFVLVLGGIFNFKKYKREVLFLSIWFLFPVMIQAEFSKTFTARYILYSIPPLFILAASSINLKFFRTQKLFLGIILLYFLQALRYDYLLLFNIEKANLPRSERSGYLEEWTSGTGLAEVSSYIKDLHKSNPDKQIVIGTEGYFGTLPDGLQMYLDGVPKVTVIGIGLGINKVPVQLIESKTAGNSTFLVANSTRLLFEEPFENYGLKVIKGFPKALRDKETPEYILHGEREILYLLELIELPLGNLEQ